MKNLTLNLLEKETEHGFMPTMVTYLLDGEEKRPAVVICPGGGYSHTSQRESERIAVSYNAAGYHAFVVYYRVSPHRHPAPINDVANAIRIVRQKAEEWFVEENHIAVCGFSAGGHLAASISTLWNDCEIFGDNAEKNKLHRPDASILCYPVITSAEFSHGGSFKNLTGKDADDYLYKKLSLENAVNEDTPVAFLWHTFEDTAVPVENSLLYASSLRKHNIAFELHIFPKGGHGLSLVSDEKNWSVQKFARAYPWHKFSVEWLNQNFGYTE